MIALLSHLVKKFDVTSRVAGVPGPSQRVCIDKDGLVGSLGFDDSPFVILAWRVTVESKAMIANDESMLRRVTVIRVNHADKTPLVPTDTDGAIFDTCIGAGHLTSRAATRGALLNRRNGWWWRGHRLAHWRLYAPLGVTAASRRGGGLPLISRLNAHARRFNHQGQRHEHQTTRNSVLEHI